MCHEQDSPARECFRVGGRGGISLLEVLVVIGVIGLLLAIVLPALSAARERGRRIQCAAQLRELGRATQMIMQEEGALPFFVFGLPRAPLIGRLEPREALEDHIESATIIRCPSDPNDWGEGENAWYATSYDYWPGTLMNFDAILARDVMAIRKTRTNKMFNGESKTIFTETQSRHQDKHNEILAPDWHVSFED